MAHTPTARVAQIKKYLEAGYRIGELSDAFQMSRAAISKIKSGKTHPRVRPSRSVPELDAAAAKVLAELYGDVDDDSIHL